MKYWVLMRARARAGCQGGGEAGEDDGYLLLLAQAVADGRRVAGGARLLVCITGTGGGGDGDGGQRDIGRSRGYGGVEDMVESLPLLL